KRIEPYRQELWPQIRGNVLEIGPGYGEALGMLRRAKQGGLVDAKAITRYVALEPNAYLHSQLTINAQSNGFLVQYDVNTCPNATAFLRDNAPYDYIVSSMVLCSVDDVEANLRAIFDLLAPGGRFVFIEHVHHTDSSDPTVVPGAKGTVTKPFDVAMWRRVQDVLSPVWRIFSGNCHLNREPARVLHDMGAGWSAIEYKTIRGSGGFMEKLAPLIYGVATK
ncbi:S-adenosyl-L-methionine-dependent methyltransferase, partial [Martensiomyces pterosporus]